MSQLILFLMLKVLVGVFTTAIELQMEQLPRVKEPCNSGSGFATGGVPIQGEIYSLECIAPGSIHCAVSNSTTTTPNANGRKLEDLPEAEGI